MTEYVKFESITKIFPGVTALDRISFGIDRGSIHGLIGENGAGKSTLLKILSGSLAPTSGSIVIDGRRRTFRSTKEAIQSGISVIHQELNLVPEMSVAENLFLGHIPSSCGFINKGKLRQMARKQIESLGEKIDLDTRVKRLSIGQRQMIEIAKALLQNAEVIAFDEPTSSLSDKEAGKLFSVMEGLKKSNCVIIYVSHRLEEIFRICDKVTVFRDGRIVESFASMADITHDLLVNRMVGRSIADIYHYTPRPKGDNALEVDGLTGYGLKTPASFSVAKGEIVGFFGLVGAGRSELMKLIFGATRRVSGTIRVLNRELKASSIRNHIRRGISFCPEDRKSEGIIPIRSVKENINLCVRRLLSKWGFIIDEAKERNNALDFIRKLNIKTPSLNQPLMNLSGGNQQKVILARWLSEKVNLILMDEPTRGIDVGAKSEIYSLIYGLAEAGLGVVVVSSELPEILGICDRIIVMREGMIVGSFERSEATQEKILRLALPGSPENDKG